MEPIRVRKEPLHLAGISAKLPPQNSPPPARGAVIQELTRSFLQKAIEITNRIGNERYSVIENDVWENGSDPIIRVMVAVDSHQRLPAWCESLTIEPGRYAVFEHKGLPRDISKTVADIHTNWTNRIPELFKRNFELFIYPPEYDPTNPNGSFEYWLPLS